MHFGQEYHQCDIVFFLVHLIRRHMLAVELLLFGSGCVSR